MKWHVQHNERALDSHPLPWSGFGSALGWSYVRGTVSDYSFTMRRRRMDARVFLLVDRSHRRKQNEIVLRFSGRVQCLMVVCVTVILEDTGGGGSACLSC